MKEKSYQVLQTELSSELENLHAVMLFALAP